MTKKIKLTQGKFALVDDDDYENLNKHKWFAAWHGWAYYAQRRTTMKNGRQIQMHRKILGLEYKDGKIVDHINRKPLDNRRANLRVVKPSENNQNHSGYSHNTSGHNGVAWHKRDKEWQAYISIDNKRIYLGGYENIDDAIRARLEGEAKYWQKTIKGDVK